ncbi:hypothetical protein VN12_08550 [Pirellula sp. SH-Sr6A]|uniref:hypothetical protein n=1 Tax=Pirellula sp. SH-Sr6A TaxID=1632865 RepID=UPI00078CF240|nr:hypothetical protein [Pirellula sp. SH-Sr6A]AMV32159.1 hypothetical protein VN12_08550 [Pirellula sp. SH-Sr6A]
MSFISLLTVGHVVISLVAIALGPSATKSIINGRNRSKSVTVYFLFTALTPLTGFAFPIVRFTPGIAFGLLTILLLILASVAIRKADANKRWHFAFLMSALVTLYLNCVVLVVQSFQKISVLKTLAPTQSEPPFLAAQVILLLGISFVSWRGYRAIFHGKSISIDSNS